MTRHWTPITTSIPDYEKEKFEKLRDFFYTEFGQGRVTYSDLIVKEIHHMERMMNEYLKEKQQDTQIGSDDTYDLHDRIKQRMRHKLKQRLTRPQKRILEGK